MLIQENCMHSRRVQSAVLFAGLLLLVLNAWALPADRVDVSTEKSAPHPLSIAKEVMLANDYLFGRGVAQDPKLSAYWLEKAAGSGDPEAEMEMGYFYETGIGVTKSLESAAHWYQLAGHGGLPEAKLNLGILYFWGTGVPQDREMAAELFREAAEKGVGLAACKLGAMYASGTGVPLDRSEAERWYTKGAKLHNPQSQYELGLLLLSQTDHMVDLRKSENLFRASAASGYVPAMYTLGLLVSRHPDLAKTPGEAVQFLEESASAGIWKSSETLGVLARDGNGVPKDDKTAYFHFRVAALQGGDEARKTLETELQRLSAKIKPSLTIALDTEAQDWYEKHHLVLEFVFKKDSRAPYSFSAFAAPKEGEHQLQLVTTLPDERTTDRGVQTANVLVK